MLAGVRKLAGVDLAVEARVQVAREGQHWHLVLTVGHDTRGATREIDAESCTAAADAAAVILALSVDSSPPPGSDVGAGAPPVRTEAQDAGAPAPPEEPRERARTDDASESSAIPAVHRERGPFPVFAIATAASDTGTLPRTAVGAAVGAGVDWSYLRLEATVGYWPSVSGQVGPNAQTGSFSMVVTSVRGCVLGEAAFLSFGPCAGVDVTWMQADGLDASKPGSSSAAWTSFAADALLRARISRYVVPRLSAGVVLPFTRPTFEVQDQETHTIDGTVHQPSVIALEIGAGLEIHF